MEPILQHIIYRSGGLSKRRSQLPFPLSSGAQFFILFVSVKQKSVCYFMYVKLENTGLVANTVNVLWGLLWGTESVWSLAERLDDHPPQKKKKKSHEQFVRFESDMSVNCLEVGHKSFA